MFILLGGCSRGQYSSRLARIQSRIVHGKIPSPACGGRGSHEKNARIFFMGTREGGRRPEGGNTKLAFIPLGSCSQTQYSSRLTTAHKPSICPAWRPLTNPAFVTLAGRPQTQRLSRLAAVRELSIYPAWRLSASPRFIPLGGRSQTPCLSRLALPRTQHLSRLAVAANPGFIPLGCCPQTQYSSRLAAARNPVFIPLGGCPQIQYLSRLAAAHESSIYPAWRLPTNPAFIPLSSYPQTQCLSCLVAFCLLKSPLARALFVGVKRFTAWRCR